MPAIFISHSNLDRAVATKIKGWLEGMGYEQVFLDFDKTTGIIAGEHWEQKLYKEIRRCHAVILVLTANWTCSKWCFVELTQARALEKVIIPIICEPGASNPVPEIQAFDLNAEAVDLLRDKLLAISNELARGFTLPRGRSPYPGILAFEAEDAAIFFGRDQETLKIIDHLDARRTQGGEQLIVIIGASGSGKSSLLKAGVLPQLARRKDVWAVLPTMRPEKRPLEGLAKSVSLYLGQPDKWREWHERVKDPGSALHHIEELVKDMRVGAARSTTVLLPIDQFEELFTVADPSERERFIELLGLLLDSERDLPLMTIATGRSDVLLDLLQASVLGQFCENHPLGPMRLDEVPRLIEGPASVAGLNIDDGLSECIARDVENLDALPLFAYTVYLLYERCKANRTLSLSEYRALGDSRDGKQYLNPIQNSVRLVADQVIGKPAQDELDALRDAFIPYLVRVRLDDKKRVRQQARAADLPKDSWRLAKALVEARLLSSHVRTDDGPELDDDANRCDGPIQDNANTNAADTDDKVGRGETAVIEVAHEALFKAWPTLDGWLTQEEEFLTDLERLRTARDIWLQAGKKDEALLRGVMLTRATHWFARYPRRFVGRDMESLRLLITSSGKAEAQRTAEEEARKTAEATRKAEEEAAKARYEAQTRRMQRRLTRGAIIAAIVFAAIALVAGIEFVQANGARRTAELERSAAESERNTALTNQSRFLVDLSHQQYDTGNFATAILLSLEALPDARINRERPHLPEAESALYQSVTALREQHVLRGHLDQVWSAAFSPNGRLVVTAAWDKTAIIWDANSGKQLAVLKGHADRLYSAAFSPNSKQVVTASWDQTARIWNVADGQQAAVLQGHTDDVYSAAFSPDGSRVVTASKDGTARIWDAKTGHQLFALSDHTDAVNSAAFSPDGQKVVTASADHTAALWNADDGTLIKVLKGHDDAVLTAAFSSEGKKVVTASSDRTARIWAADTGVQLEVLRGHEDEVLGAAFSPGDQTIVTASADRTARLWNATNGKLIATLRGHSKEVVAASFSPDGQHVVTASSDGTARVWNARDGALQAILAGHDESVTAAAWSPDSRRVVTSSPDATARIWAATSPVEVVTLRGHTNSISAVTFSPDGRLLATASADNTARIWDAVTEDLKVTLKGHTNRVTAVAFSPDGKLVATASVDGTARLWDATNGTELHVLEGHHNEVYSISFSPDGKLLVTAGRDNTARVWDIATGQQKFVLIGHQKLVHAAAFSPNGKWIATASQDWTARIWSVTDGSEIHVMKGHTNWVATVGFSSDSRRMVTASQDGSARIWDVTSGNLLHVLKADNEQVQSAVFSPDGRSVLTASWDDTARLWDSETGAQLQIFKGHQDRVEAALFLPDQKRVVTASYDKTARVWDAATGAQVAVLRGHEDQIHELALSPNGSKVATASDDKTARIWPLFSTTQALVDHARLIMPRELTAREHQRFFLGTP